LQSATDLAIFSGSVARLRLRSFSGQVTFSDDGSTVGALASSHPAFRSASAGHTDIAIVRDARSGPAQVIRVLQPVVANASGQATGVLELYLPYDEIAAEVQAQTRHTIWRLAGGLGVLYMVLALISWYTTRKLRRYAAQREHQALHDGLTGLPNREWFRARPRRHSSAVAVTSWELSCWWTSTTSRRSMTRWVTPRATSCSASSANG